MDLLCLYKKKMTIVTGHRASEDPVVNSLLGSSLMNTLGLHKCWEGH